MDIHSPNIASSVFESWPSYIIHEEMKVRKIWIKNLDNLSKILYLYMYIYLYRQVYLTKSFEALQNPDVRVGPITEIDILSCMYSVSRLA